MIFVDTCTRCPHHMHQLLSMHSVWILSTKNSYAHVVLDQMKEKVHKVKDIRLNTTNEMCVLGGPLVEEDDKKNAEKLKMDFHPRLYYYLKHAKRHLGIISDSKEHETLKHYMVVHWRRGDQLKTRCQVLFSIIKLFFF